jgi:hypothetical protein
VTEKTSSQKAANRFHLLAKDAGKTVEYLQRMFDVWGPTDERGILHSALMTAAITVYSRSFKPSWNCANEADRSAEISRLDVSNDPRLMEIHRMVVDARDTMIAHSDWNRRATSVIDCNEIPGTGTFGVLRQTTGAEGWENIDSKQFLELAFTVFDQARQLAGRLDRA